MAKKNKVYADAVKSVLTELGGGPIRSQDLVKAVLERGIVEDGKYVYHYLLKAARDNSDTFDTSKRGFIALNTGAPAAVAVEDSEEVETFSGGVSTP
jgi:hypothetical protein